MSQLSDAPTDGGMRAEMEHRFQARLGALEQESIHLRARTRWLGLGLLAALAIIAVGIVEPELVFMAGLGDVEVVEARRLVLMDEAGHPRGEWSVDESGNARLAMFDQQRRQRLTLSVLDGGYPGISLANAAGQRRAALGLLPDETTSLVFADMGGVPRAVLGLTRGESASLVFADAEGVSRVGLGLDGSGMGSVMLPGDTTATSAAPGESDSGG